MAESLSKYFDLNRRYFRSINLERDLDQENALDGYTLTDRAVDALKRILSGFTYDNPVNTWTLTGVYGTGKSAFTHFLLSLCAPPETRKPIFDKAMSIIKKGQVINHESFFIDFRKRAHKKEFFRAVVTAQREPLSHTIIRAIQNGLKIAQTRSSKIKSALNSKLDELIVKVKNSEPITGQEILLTLQSIGDSTGTDILIVIDELGKNLEFAVQNQNTGDLYLLQQIAEFSKKSESKIFLLGLLHQSFAEYGHELGSARQNEWSKIQGRFEDIPFIDTPGQMTRLIGQVINCKNKNLFQSKLQPSIAKWIKPLKNILAIEDISSDILASTYPLHPIASLVLPKLCIRYAQNDRSLFTFLTSAEPHSLYNFLRDSEVEDNGLPLLKLHRVYDYFVESVGMSLASRPNLQRWLEVHSLIADANKQDLESLNLLKTIGILNLATTTGALKATRNLVILAMCDQPNDSNKIALLEKNIDDLIARGLITYRKQFDELRLWEGSAFDVEANLTFYIEKRRETLANLLSKISPLKPLIAQRHSYRTGTLRYFERKYFDSSTNINNVQCSNAGYDGLIGYWLEKEMPSQVPNITMDGKPFILICIDNPEALKPKVLEFIALQEIEKDAVELQRDGVARREVNHRLIQAKILVDEALKLIFEFAGKKNVCFIDSKIETISSAAALNSKLSNICDNVYSEVFILWNELINRRELTSQGAKARRLLIEAMLESHDKERLGLTGNGPEVSMYISVLERTGIHRKEGEILGFYPPTNNDVTSAWKAIENFCLQSTVKPRSLKMLYDLLEAPPYGIKQSIIPVLLAAVTLYHVDDVSIYRDGSFVPVLGIEHFELLVKNPSRFSVKFFEIAGLRAQVFRELEDILRKPNKTKISVGMRNTTLLSVVKPLFQFTKKLPPFTHKTKRLSQAAKTVLKTLLQAQEPDELLFILLPQACGLPPIVADEIDDGERAKNFRVRFVQILKEIQTVYDVLLSDCHDLLHHAFGVRADKEKLREDLRVRSYYLADRCIEPILKRFLCAAVEDSTSDQEWLEALVMIIADKPAEAWSDEDYTNFEIKLSDLARRFKNLEALRLENKHGMSEGFEARRITITRPDGRETHEMVWVDNECVNHVESLIKSFISENQLENDHRLQLAVLARLSEFILENKSKETEHPFQIKEEISNEQERDKTHTGTIRRQR